MKKLKKSCLRFLNFISIVYILTHFGLENFNNLGTDNLFTEKQEEIAGYFHTKIIFSCFFKHFVINILNSLVNHFQKTRKNIEYFQTRTIFSFLFQHFVMSIFNSRVNQFQPLTAPLQVGKNPHFTSNSC